jgi:deoxyribodipyrimidine photolyase-related protein
MTHLVLLSHHLNQAYFNQIKPDKITIVLTKEQFTFVSYHQFRILYHMSAAKHFAKEHDISYVYVSTWNDFFDTVPAEETIMYFEPTDIWMKNQLEEATSNHQTKTHPDLNFYFPYIERELPSPPYKLDPLYRKWRKQFDILMENSSPVGGQYSYDSSNRKSPPKQLHVPPPMSFDMDEMSKELYLQIQQDFPNNPSSKKDFQYPVTKTDAEALLDHFILYRLPHFGQYQDAMMEKEPFMVHSLLSASINLGILLAKDVVKRLIEAYQNGLAPIEAVEGFVRQVLGWREYIRGIYLVEMKNDYEKSNRFEHTRPLPDFFYNADTSLYCLKTTIQETIDHAYNHHIQRLMILGNLANLMAISPQDIRRWFNEMYIDSFDWVVTPNVIGMAMYADGGKMSTKPYIASANYIHKMSNYCKNCTYDPKIKEGPKACPINALYYQFLDRHKDPLVDNPRMGFMYRNYQKLSEDQLKEYKAIANRFTKELKS